MGKVNITENNGDGLYTATILKKTQRLASRIVNLTAQIAKIDANLADWQAKFDAAVPAYLQAQANYQAAIMAVFEAIAQENIELLKQREAQAAKLLTQLELAEKELRKWRDLISLETLTRQTKQQQLTEMQGIVDFADSRQLWCGDYSTDIAVGEVQSIEVNGESQTIIIHPQDQDYKAISDYTAPGRIDKLNNEITATQAKITDAQTKIAAVDIDIADLLDDIAAINDKINALTADIVQASNFYANKNTFDVVQDNYNALLAEQKRLTNEISGEYLRKNGFEQAIIAYQTDIAGLRQKINDITAGTDNRKLEPTHNSGPYAVGYNVALMAGWQKWRPTYRTGYITAIDYAAETCAIDLDPAFSVQHTAATNSRLNINQSDTLIDVPIVYMTCNAAVFEAGDHVVVAFSENWETPIVIGFSSHPKACGGIVTSVKLGTGSKALMFTVDATTLDVTKKDNTQPLMAGNIDWRNDKTILTWRGPYTRVLGPSTDVSATDKSGTHQIAALGYFNRYFASAGGLFLAYADRWENELFKSGKSIPCPGAVIGAGINNGVIIAVMYQRSDLDTDYVYYFDEISLAWVLIDTIVYGQSGVVTLNRRTPAFFNDDGTQFITAVDLFDAAQISDTQYRPKRRFGVYHITGDPQLGYAISQSSSEDSDGAYSVSSEKTYNQSIDLGNDDYLLGGWSATHTESLSTYTAAKDWISDGIGGESIGELVVRKGAVSYGSSLSASPWTASENFGPTSKTHEVIFRGATVYSKTTQSQLAGSAGGTGSPLYSSTKTSSQTTHEYSLLYCDIRNNIIIIAETERSTNSTATQSYDDTATPGSYTTDSSSGKNISYDMHGFSTVNFQIDAFSTSNNSSSDLANPSQTDFSHYFSIGSKVGGEIPPPPPNESSSGTQYKQLDGDPTYLAPNAQTVLPSYIPGLVHLGIDKDATVALQLSYGYSDVDENVETHGFIGYIHPGNYTLLDQLYAAETFAGEKQIFGYYTYATSNATKDVGLGVF